MMITSFVSWEYIENLKYTNKNALSKRQGIHSVMAGLIYCGHQKWVRASIASAKLKLEPDGKYGKRWRVCSESPVNAQCRYIALIERVADYSPNLNSYDTWFWNLDSDLFQLLCVCTTCQEILGLMVKFKSAITTKRCFMYTIDISPVLMK